MAEEKKSGPAPAALRAILIKAAEREPGSLPDPFQEFYTTGKVVNPPLPFANLKIIVEQSNILPQCIEAMARNVGGYGYTLKCRVPEDEAVSIEAGIREEFDRLDSFWRYCATDMSLTRLRYMTQYDLEIYGNAWWEVLRQNDGQIVGFAYLPALTMRAGAEAARVKVKAKRMEAKAWEFREDEDYRVFRPFAQIVGTTMVWFKEFGDPRTLSRETGKVLSQVADPSARVENKDAREVIHFTVGPKSGVYGQPRWIGNLLSAAGSRSAEEVNWFTFEDQGLGRFMLLVTGGTLTEGILQKIKEFAQSKKDSGTEAFHKGIVIEGVSSSAGGSVTDGTKEPVKIEYKEVGHIDEALFQHYDKDNRTKLRSAFRLPLLYTGETGDYTRATAKESREVAEDQVFGPERQDFDEWVTRMVFPELDAVYHEFRSNGARMSSDEDREKLWTEASKAGMPLIHVVKGLAEILGVKIDEEALALEDWAQKPLALGRSASAPVGFGVEPPPGGADNQLAKIADVIAEAREALKRGKDGTFRTWFGRILGR